LNSSKNLQLSNHYMLGAPTRKPEEPKDNLN
jgi:hypothetical protein